ncbi:MAG: cytochrome b/b6 domain-containing protein [Dehalococcoidia bacterium]
MSARPSSAGGHGTAGSVVAPALIERFALETRLFHWLNAAPFIFLLTTGLLLLLPGVKAINAGGHRLVALAHVVVGLALLAALVVFSLLVRRRRLLADLRRALTPEAGDAAWARFALWSALGAKVAEPPSGKYNLGQKLSSAFWIGAVGGLIVTGVVLAINYASKQFLDPAFVERVFPVHAVLAYLAVPLLAAHLYLALVNRATRPSLRGMLTGRVEAAWARRHHARWVAEAEKVSE